MVHICNISHPKDRNAFSFMRSLFNPWNKPFSLSLTARHTVTVIITFKMTKRMIRTIKERPPLSLQAIKKMGRRIQIEEAQRKWKSIMDQARKLGVEPESLAALAEARKIPTFKHPILFVFLTFVVPVILAIFGLNLHSEAISFYLDWKDGVISKVECVVPMPDRAYILFRPPVSCAMCENITMIEKISKVTPDEFENKYAYSGRPVVITDVTDTWTAPMIFSLDFFRSLYDASLKVWLFNKCQFFPYKTDFKNLGEFLEYDHGLDPTAPWYVGWSNCDIEVTQILRQHYGRPYFLPDNSEGKRLDWIFMGSKGFGAPMHIDNVEYPSWQAQLKGRKKWRLQPPMECYYSCMSMEIIVEPGETIVLDTNRWFHSTEIVSDEISITIGAEYD